MQQRDKLHSRFLNYLKDPSNQQQSFAIRKQVRFLLTFLGELFIKGYRIQQFGLQATIILSLNDFNNQILLHDQIKANKFVEHYEYLPKFLIVALQYDNNYISKHRQQRIYLYKRLKTIHEFLQEPTQIYIIYLQNRAFSKLLPEQLYNTLAPNVKGYFEKKKFKLQRNMFSSLSCLKEGENMHKVIQIFIKGCGRSRNLGYMEKQVIGSYKFRYFPEYTINTIYYVVAKQMIQGKYVTICSEKWMRKTTKKKFRRYDLILRNQDSVCILDWKFSTQAAQDLLNSFIVDKKNKQYYQLAKKSYKSEVNLKYIVLNPQLQDNYHIYQAENYKYKTEQFQVDDSESQMNRSCSQQDINSINNQKSEAEQQAKNKNPKDQITNFQKQIRQKQIEANKLKNDIEISKVSQQPEEINSANIMEIEQQEYLGQQQNFHQKSAKLTNDGLCSTVTKTKIQKRINQAECQVYSSPKPHQKQIAQSHAQNIIFISVLSSFFVRQFNLFFS